MNKALRLGTRASPLALAQAHQAARLLADAHNLHPDQIEIVSMRASGDLIQDRALAEVGGKALWTKELDRALVAGEIDFAVHSMKDVETIRPPEIVIAAMLEREDPRDRLIGAESIGAIRQGGKVGTSSPRRAAQIRRLRPDVEVVLFRGNVATRLRKLQEGVADATFLAAAGLRRLGQDDLGATIPVELMLPAPAQGAIGIECLAERGDIRALLDAIDHRETHRCVLAERALLAGLAADCRSPVSALAVLDGEEIRLRAEIFSGDGAESVPGERRVPADAPEAAAALAGELLGKASPDLRRLFGA